MPDTLNVGSVEQHGYLNPRQIAKIQIADGISVLDATSEQFDTFARAFGVRIENGEEGDVWSYENRCRFINHVQRYKLTWPTI